MIETHIEDPKNRLTQRKIPSTGLVSVVTPVYNEEDNLSELYDRLRSVMDGLDLEWEWLVVDDHSIDSKTFRSFLIKWR